MYVLLKRATLKVAISANHAAQNTVVNATNATTKSAHSVSLVSIRSTDQG